MEEQKIVDVEQAWKIAGQFVKECVELYEEHLMSIVLTGSLSRGSYQPGLSDIDVATILCDGTPECVTGSVSALYGQISELHTVQFEPIIFRFQDLFRPWNDDLEVQPELLRLKASGQTLYGKDIIPDLPTPTKQEIWEHDLYFRNWLLEHEPEWSNSQDLSLTGSLKAILSAATWYLYYKAEVVEFSRHDIWETFSRRFPDFPYLESLERASCLWQNFFEVAATETLRREMAERARNFHNYVTLAVGFREHHMLR